MLTQTRPPDRCCSGVLLINLNACQTHHLDRSVLLFITVERGKKESYLRLHFNEVIIKATLVLRAAE